MLGYKLNSSLYKALSLQDSQVIPYSQINLLL